MTEETPEKSSKVFCADFHGSAIEGKIPVPSLRLPEEYYSCGFDWASLIGLKS